MLRSFPLLVTLALVASAPAQSYVVDPANGPGTHFTNLATATAQVPDGATVVVRAGQYFYPVTVANKGITLAGEPGCSLLSLTVSGQAPTQRVVLRGLHFGFFGVHGQLHLQSCQSAVVIEDCVGSPSPQFGAMSLSISSCPQVSVARSEFLVGSNFTASHVVCEATEFDTNQYTGPALVLVNGRTELVHCTVFGATSGISTNGNQLRLLGNTSVAAAAGPAVVGSGSLHVAPSVGSLTVAGGIAPNVVDAGAVRSTAATLGGVVGGTLEGSASLFGALYFGLVRPPVAVPGIAELLWIEPYDVSVAGVLAAPLPFGVQVPDLPILRGFTFGWQGVTAGVGGIVLSNPVLFSVR